MAYLFDQDFYLKVKFGKVPGYSIVNKFGANYSVGSTAVPVTEGGVFGTPTSSVALEILSSDANDTVSGSGAWSVYVEGLDENYDLSSETVSLNGTTPVALTKTYTRVHRSYVVDTGTYATDTVGSHSGTITVRDTAGNEFIRISTTPALGSFPNGQTLCGVYSIPINKTGFIISKKISVESAKLPSIALFYRQEIHNTTPPYSAMRLQQIDVGLNIPSDYYPKSALGPYIGPCDLGFLARVPTTTAAVEVDYEILIIDNDKL